MSDTPNTNGDFELQVLEEEHRLTHAMQGKSLSLCLNLRHYRSLHISKPSAEVHMPDAGVGVCSVVKPVKTPHPRSQARKPPKTENKTKKVNMNSLSTSASLETIRYLLLLERMYELR